MNDERQHYCREFKEILPRRANGLREYGQSDDWRAPVGDNATSGRIVFARGGAQCLSANPLPLILRVLDFIPPGTDDTMPSPEPANVSRVKRAGSNPAEGFRGAVKEWATGSGFDPDSNVVRTETGHLQRTMTFNCASIPDNGRSVAAPRPFPLRPMSPELRLEHHKRWCAKCGKREVYQYSRTMNWCEECLWDLIKDDQK